MNSPLHHAYACLDHVRSLGIVSPGKHPRVAPRQNINIALARQIRLNDELTALRTGFDAQGGSFFSAQGVLDAAAYFSAARIGGCGELGAAAARYLHSQSIKDFCLVHYPLPGDDHLFIAIGQPADQNGGVPRRFIDWDAEAAICDVWADIACPARNYPVRWRARMDNWQIMHQDINLQQPWSLQWYHLVHQPKAIAADFSCNLRACV